MLLLGVKTLKKNRLRRNLLGGVSKFSGNRPIVLGGFQKFLKIYQFGLGGFQNFPKSANLA